MGFSGCCCCSSSSSLWSSDSVTVFAILEGLWVDSEVVSSKCFGFSDMGLLLLFLTLS